jgi:pimeloyl-ACP methyl ester carboxylesterase
MTTPVPVIHRTTEIDGIEIFYREAGPAEAPVVLLPHGYPCSSFEFRHFMAAFGDRWRLLAPDYPGFGYSATPERSEFAYTFDAYSDLLARFVETLGLERYAIYLHDYGSQFGLRLALRAPERVAALIIQNGDIYEDQMGPRYEWLKSYWQHSTAEGRAQMASNVSEEGLRENASTFEYGGDVPAVVPAASRVPS